MWQKAIIGSGGSETEDILWENPDPTQSYLGDNISVKDINNYKFIELTCKRKNGLVVSVRFKIEDFKKFTDEKGGRGYIGETSSDGTAYVRSILYRSDTTIAIGGSYAAGVSRMDNSFAIPLKISGIS